MTTRTEPTETVMNITETKQQFSKVINQVARGATRIVVEKSGAPVAAIISSQELQEFKRFKEEDRERRGRLFERLARLGDAFESVSDEELEAEIQKTQAEVKNEMASERKQG